MNAWQWFFLVVAVLAAVLIHVVRVSLAHHHGWVQGMGDASKVIRAAMKDAKVYEDHHKFFLLADAVLSKALDVGWYAQQYRENRLRGAVDSRVERLNMSLESLAKVVKNKDGFVTGAGRG